MFLSVFLIPITAVSIAVRTVPQEEREDGMTYQHLAILKLKVKEKVQGALVLVTALASMYLFSALGVRGTPNRSIFWAGVAGAMTLGVAALREFFSVVSRSSQTTGDGLAGPSSGLSEASNVSADPRLSMGSLEEDMIIVSMVLSST